jgi:hypothetical protein
MLCPLVCTAVCGGGAQGQRRAVGGAGAGHRHNRRCSARPAALGLRHLAPAPSSARPAALKLGYARTVCFAKGGFGLSRPGVAALWLLTCSVSFIHTFIPSLTFIALREYHTGILESCHCLPQEAFPFGHAGVAALYMSASLSTSSVTPWTQKQGTR